jgi:hypothetical protein
LQRAHTGLEVVECEIAHGTLDFIEIHDGSFGKCLLESELSSNLAKELMVVKWK